jgi:hypothetical protein
MIKGPVAVRRFKKALPKIPLNPPFSKGEEEEHPGGAGGEGSILAAWFFSVNLGLTTEKYSIRYSSDQAPSFKEI